MTPLFTPGTLRQPRIQILLAGAIIPGLVSMEVDSNSHYQADTWRATMALNAIGGHTMDWWGSDSITGQTFTLQARLLPSDPWKTLIVGEADKVELDVVNGGVSLSGRDLTGRLIDAKTQKAYKNQTASQVITALAQERGLNPVVTATTTLVSRYYQQDHDRVTQDQFSRVSTEWDLAKYLAQQEGFDLFVDGQDLHFQPQPAVKPDPFVVTWDAAARSSNVLDIKLERSLTLAKDVLVVVRSWNSRQGRAFTRMSGKGGANSVQSGKAQRYTYTFPNLSEDAAQKKADDLRAEISQHERNAVLTLPVELVLTPRGMVSLQGFGTSWDQPYYVASISRAFNEDGTQETVNLKNVSPESQATVG